MNAFTNNLENPHPAHILLNIKEIFFLRNYQFGSTYRRHTYAALSLLMNPAASDRNVV